MDSRRILTRGVFGHLLRSSLTFQCVFFHKFSNLFIVPLLVEHDLFYQSHVAQWVYTVSRYYLLVAFLSHFLEILNISQNALQHSIILFTGLFVQQVPHSTFNWSLIHVLLEQLFSLIVEALYHILLSSLLLFKLFLHS